MVYLVSVIQFASFVSVVIAFALRIEHRITKIETDVSWLKRKMNCSNDNGKGDS